MPLHTYHYTIIRPTQLQLRYLPRQSPCLGQSALDRTNFNDLSTTPTDFLNEGNSTACYSVHAGRVQSISTCACTYTCEKVLFDVVISAPRTNFFFSVWLHRPLGNHICRPVPMRVMPYTRESSDHNQCWMFVIQLPRKFEFKVYHEILKLHLKIGKSKQTNKQSNKVTK